VSDGNISAKLAPHARDAVRIASRSHCAVTAESDVALNAMLVDGLLKNSTKIKRHTDEFTGCVASGAIKAA